MKQMTKKKESPTILFDLPAPRVKDIIESIKAQRSVIKKTVKATENILKRKWLGIN